MAEEITYELIDITFELPYELQEEAQMVREDGPVEEKLGMEEVITEAKFVCKVKAKDNSNQKPFKEMMILRYHSELLGIVKMTVGIRKRTQEKVQYSITVPTPEIPFVDAASIIRESSKKKKRKKRPQ